MTETVLFFIWGGLIFCDAHLAANHLRYAMEVRRPGRSMGRKLHLRPGLGVRFPRRFRFRYRKDLRGRHGGNILPRRSISRRNSATVVGFLESSPGTFDTAQLVGGMKHPIPFHPE